MWLAVLLLFFLFVYLKFFYHLLLTGNDTVPISVWCGGIHFTECTVTIIIIVLLLL